MILSKPGATAPFTPKWLLDRKPKPVFHLKAADIIERQAFEAELSGSYNAGEIFDFVLKETALSGIRHLTNGDDSARFVDLIEQEFALDPGEKMPADEAAILGEARDILTQHWPAYASLKKQQARRNQLLPTLAFCTFCSGWENITGSNGQLLEFARDKMGNIPNEILSKVPHLMLHAAGVEAYSRQYGRGEAKNSAPPSKSSPAPKTSNMGGESKKGGKSGKTSGKKTQS